MMILMWWLLQTVCDSSPYTSLACVAAGAGFIFFGVATVTCLLAALGERTRRRHAVHQLVLSKGLVCPQ